MPGLWIQRWWRTILRKPSITVLLAKIRLGHISVHCSELRSVRFSEVRNIYGKINRGKVICLLYRGCPLFRGSVFRFYCMCIILCTTTEMSFRSTQDYEVCCSKSKKKTTQMTSFHHLLHEPHERNKDFNCLLCSGAQSCIYMVFVVT